jgi:hypothetical protein
MPPWPRPEGLAAARLLAELGATARALARLYQVGATATPSPPDLHRALAGLAAAKADQAAALEPLAAALGGPGGPPAAPPRLDLDGLGARGAVFPQAFPLERAFAAACAELRDLVVSAVEGQGEGAAGVAARLGTLAAGAARDRRVLWELYLRYS